MPGGRPSATHPPRRSRCQAAGRRSRTPYPDISARTPQTVRRQSCQRRRTTRKTPRNRKSCRGKEIAPNIDGLHYRSDARSELHFHAELNQPRVGGGCRDLAGGGQRWLALGGAGKDDAIREPEIRAVENVKCFQ